MCPETNVVAFPNGGKTAAASPASARVSKRLETARGLVLNKSTVKKLACEPGKTETLHRDQLLPGFILRCYANGRRMWLVQYRDESGATRRVNIGDAAVIEADDARAKAKDLLADVTKGTSPAVRRDEARQATRFGDAVTQYLTYAESRVKPATLKETRRNLVTHCATLNRTAVKDVKRATIAELHDEVSIRNGKVVANRVLAALSSFFSWAIGRGLVEANPVIRMPRNSEKARDRVLSDDEIRAIWKATGSESDFDRIVRLLILTGTRRSEVGDMQQSELQDNLWTIAGERTKNGLPHEIQLTDVAWTYLPAMQEEENASGFIFGKRANSGFSGWSKSKAKLDKAIGFDNWSLHDIRRTFSTRLHDELGVAPHIVEALLNHISGHKSGVGGTYNRAQYRSQKAAALEAWAALITRIVDLST